VVGSKALFSKKSLLALTSQTFVNSQYVGSLHVTIYKTKIKWFDLVCFQASGAPRPENWDSDEIPNPYWIYYAKFALCWFPASHYFKNYVHSQKIKLFDSEIPDPSWIYFIRILEFTLIRILHSHLFKYSNNSNTIPKTHHVIHALSKFNYIFSSCMHSKRYSQEEVRFWSQMLYHS
jgi:hypothetical protein